FALVRKGSPPGPQARSRHCACGFPRTTCPPPFRTADVFSPSRFLSRLRPFPIRLPARLRYFQRLLETWIAAHCIQDFDNHQPCTPGPLRKEGQAVYAVAYERRNGADLGSHAARQLRWDKCVDEAYAILPREAQKRSEEHTSELQSLAYLVCRLLLEKKKDYQIQHHCSKIEQCHIPATQVRH